MYLAAESIITLGLTGGGGTGSTVRIIQSGLEYLTLKPSASQSSSDMRRRISCAFSAVISNLRSISEVISPSSSPYTIWSRNVALLARLTYNPSS